MTILKDASAKNSHKLSVHSNKSLRQDPFLWGSRNPMDEGLEEL